MGLEIEEGLGKQSCLSTLKAACFLSRYCKWSNILIFYNIYFDHKNNIKIQLLKKLLLYSINTVHGLNSMYSSSAGIVYISYPLRYTPHSLPAVAKQLQTSWIWFFPVPSSTLRGNWKSVNQLEMTQSSVTKVFVSQWEKHTCPSIWRCLFLYPDREPLIIYGKGHVMSFAFRWTWLSFH